MELIKQYFPNLSPTQYQQLDIYGQLLTDWNSKINVISRKDIENVYDKHILHALAIAKVVNIKPNSEILDVGTGGGIPGIPLSIIFPESNFTLIDGIAKKIVVVQDIIEKLELQNVTAKQVRVEELHEKFDFVIGRGVTDLEVFNNWIIRKIKKKQLNALPNGVLYLKGGDLSTDKKAFKRLMSVYAIQDYFPLDFFIEKYVIHLDLSY